MGISDAEIMLILGAISHKQRRMHLKKIFFEIIPFFFREIRRHHRIVKINTRFYRKTAESMLQVYQQLIFIGTAPASEQTIFSWKTLLTLCYAVAASIQTYYT